jgi:autotransporter strand-loop-strand O-heptosyltransferase
MSKILYITPHLSTGGLPQYLYKKIEKMYKKNDIYLIEWEDLSPIYRVQKDLIKEILPKSNFISWPQNVDQQIKINGILGHIKEENFDIIHIEEFPEWFLPKELINKIYVKDRSYKLIETSHSSGFSVENKEVLPDAFVFVSESQLEKFKKLKVPSHLLKYQIEDYIRPNRDEGLTELGLDLSWFHVINVGLFTPGKNQKYAIDIASRFEDSNMCFHFIGNQAENFKDYWEPIMNNLPNNCIIHGERNDVDKWYASCDLLLFTSLSELNPLVPREAISWKIPVLMHNLPIYRNEYNQYSNVTYLTNDIDEDVSSFKDILQRDIETDINLEQIDFYEKLKTIYEDTIIQHIDLNKCKINYNFINGPFAEVLEDNKDNRYTYEFFDGTKRIYHNVLPPNHYASVYRRWYTDWCIKISKDDQEILHYQLNLSEKKVLISFESSSLGDTIAWIPYVEEFRKKHSCELVCSTFWNNLFQESYPEIKFIKPGIVIDDISVKYILGCFNPPNDLKWHPSDWRSGPLQKVASDILGLEYEEIITKIDIPKDSVRPFEEKYVCMSIHSSAQCKYWNNPKGWQKTVDYLNKQGYTVVNIAKETGTYMGNKSLRGVLDRSGDFPIEERINYLKHAEFYIGISSGLTWVSCAIGTPAIMISGVTAPFNEPDAMIKVHNNNVCNGCFNNEEYIFDKGNWNWCPRNNNFICSKAITSEMVIRKIESLLDLEKQTEETEETETILTSGPKYQRLVIITGIYNGREYIEKCINSIKSQQYTNFRCFIVDDCSLDDTIRLTLKAIDGDQRFSVIVNSEKKYGLQNIYNTLYRTDINNSDIVIQVDGDDYLPDNLVFNRIIDEYNKNDVWLTYGSFQQFHSGSLVNGWAAEVDYNSVRYKDDSWNVTHLKTFLVNLFRKIKLQDLLNSDGNFYKYTADIAIMLPMIEMAGEHAKYLSEFNYIYNNLNPFNEYNVNSEAQLRSALEIRGKDRYSPLENFD